MHKIIQPQGNFQIQLTFQYAGTGGCSSIHSPMPGINNDRGAVGYGGVFRQNGNGMAAPDAHQQEAAQQHQIYPQTKPVIAALFQISHLKKLYARWEFPMHQPAACSIE